MFKTKKHRVFLDFASATPTRKEVAEVMKKYSERHFENPSALYLEAREVKEIMQKARAEVGEFLNTAKERIVFTASGTEANNIAILGVFEMARKNGIINPHIISVLTEHPSVREVLDEVKYRGGEVTLLTPDSDGLISAQQVISALKENTVLVSVMYVNNEIGVVQPIREIARVLRSKKQEARSTNENENKYPYFHVDACQAGLFYSLDVSTSGVDLLTLDSLKVYGPAGIGCLYVKSDVNISPIMFGGGQEFGLRSGTENVAHIVGFAKALSLAKYERKELSERLQVLRDYFIDEIVSRTALGKYGQGQSLTQTAELNGSRKFRSPNNINICFLGLDAEYLVVALDTYGVCASYSSSCRTLKEDSSSYVVEALGKKDCSLSSIRFALGRETTKSDIDFALEALEKAVEQVKK